MSERTDKIDDALTDILGLHGGWVLSVEVYRAEDGRSVPVVLRPESTPAHIDLGLARLAEIACDDYAQRLMSDEP
ncbi:hypothetical protein [Luteipulveratus mongoliensis]|uniref:Uncharacterized protein n=1 Tax=Luteipulveratus mongoliensis TaxID=571913 RepID=A0A0K1JGD1_9MICO|nr:hypothetical protein [Luteipulveratus mongoliensis]AKU15759.1 hypothetical protein VV02_07675 [Luteipulveratus mongoliensis]